MFLAGMHVKMGVSGWLFHQHLWLALLDYFVVRIFLICRYIFLPFGLIWIARAEVDPSAMIGLPLGVGLTARFVGSLDFNAGCQRSIKAHYCTATLLLSLICNCIYIWAPLGLAFFGND